VNGVARLPANERRDLPAIQTRFEIVLGSANGAAWSLGPAPDNPEELVFTPPAAVAGAGGYVSTNVRLEMGSGVDPEPVVVRAIEPYAAQEFPSYFTHPTADVVVLDIVRTFCEKATILHMVNTRTKDVSLTRMSRHFYDVASFHEHECLADVSALLTTMSRAADHKADYFPTAGVDYGKCATGSLALVPSGKRLAALQSDYANMAAMFFGEVIAFDEIIRRLSVIENRLNAAARNATATD